MTTELYVYYQEREECMTMELYVYYQEREEYMTKKKKKRIGIMG